MDERPILIAYDGSENAKHAIRVAAALLGGGTAQVVHAWEPLSSASSRLAVYAFMANAGSEELDYERAQAEAKAEEGAAPARQSGFRGMLAGRVSHGVTAHSHAPVLVIPPENETKEAREWGGRTARPSRRGCS